MDEFYVWPTTQILSSKCIQKEFTWGLFFSPSYKFSYDQLVPRLTHITHTWADSIALFLLRNKHYLYCQIGRKYAYSGFYHMTSGRIIIWGSWTATDTFKALIKFQVCVCFDQELYKGHAPFFSFFDIDCLEIGFSILEALPAERDISKGQS